MKKIAEAIKKDIENRGLTQQEVAGLLETSQAYINQVLNGTKRIGRKKAEQLHNLFGYSVSFLLTGEGELNNVGKGDVETLSIKDLNRRINELLAISSSLNERIKEANDIMSKAQVQFDCVLSMYKKQTSIPSRYGMVSEDAQLDLDEFRAIDDFEKNKLKRKES